MKTYKCTKEEHAELEAIMRKSMGLPHYGRDCVGTGPRARAWIESHKDEIVTSNFAGEPSEEFPITSEVEDALVSVECKPGEAVILSTAISCAVDKPSVAVISPGGILEGESKEDMDGVMGGALDKEECDGDQVVGGSG